MMVFRWLTTAFTGRAEKRARDAKCVHMRVRRREKMECVRARVCGHRESCVSTAGQILS